MQQIEQPGDCPAQDEPGGVQLVHQHDENA